MNRLRFLPNDTEWQAIRASFGERQETRRSFDPKLRTVGGLTAGRGLQLARRAAVPLPAGEDLSWVCNRAHREVLERASEGDALSV